TPGLVDANTALGLPSAQENEQSNEITPHLQIIDLYDVEAQNVAHARRNGVTTAYITPGELNVFGGLGAVVKTAGESPVLARENGLRMTLGNMPGQGNAPFRTYGKPVGMYFRRPSNRMGVIWEIRKAFYDAIEARETAPGQVQQLSAATQTLIRALDKDLIVRTSARADQDIRTAIRLAQEFGINLVLDHVTEAYACLDDVVAAGFPVLLTAPTLEDDPEGATPHLDTARLLAARGVTLAIQSGADPRAEPLVREAAFAVRGGLSREAALAAITSVPAKILGVDDRVGSIAPGKDADVVVWSGHPLGLGSRAEHVFVNGVER
ncbi:MAG: amidohydrolase family protein, partial [Planctomycetes bacterium]|nr:amidohydrolase family protein [Planctomycetota bacterium]